MPTGRSARSCSASAMAPTWRAATSNGAATASGSSPRATPTISGSTRRADAPSPTRPRAVIFDALNRGAPGRATNPLAGTPYDGWGRQLAADDPMSRAFVKEHEDAIEELPDRPVSPHPNLVTPAGLTQIEGELAHAQQEHAAAQAAGDRAALARATRE